MRTANGLLALAAAWLTAGGVAGQSKPATEAFADIRGATHKQYSVEVFRTTLTDRSLSRTTGFQALRNILPWSPAEARSSTAPLECYDIVNGRW